jgi:hypothetical protein
MRIRSCWWSALFSVILGDLLLIAFSTPINIAIALADLTPTPGNKGNIEVYQEKWGEDVFVRISDGRPAQAVQRR